MAARIDYTAELGERICEAIATSEVGAQKLYETLEWFPSPNVIYRWLKENETFRNNYADARARQADFIFEQILEIADDSTGDELHTEAGVVLNSEFAARSRIRIDARKWVVSKLLPKKYGDKVDITTQGEKIQQEVRVITPFDRNDG